MKRSSFLKRLARTAAAVGIGVVVPDTIAASSESVLEQGKKINSGPLKALNCSGMVDYGGYESSALAFYSGDHNRGKLI